MTDSDFDHFGQLLQAIGDLYGKPVSEHAVPIWWAALKPYEIKAVQVAFSRHTTNPDGGQFMPKPADIIRSLEGGKADQAMQAWSKVDWAVRHIGGYQTVAFDDPLIHAVVSDMGGWVKINSHDDHAYQFVAKEFQDRYKAVKASGRQVQYPSSLSGIARLQNEAAGYADNDVRLIGEPATAKQVMLGGSSKSAPMVTLGFEAKRLH
jgi:hypothetical protein